MRLQELLEAATAIVYHYCGVPAAAKILTTGVFQLSSVTGNKSEEQYAPAGYPYFLSTTRSKVGDYHRYTGSSAVMFVLDGNWLNQRYKTNPVDYWDRAWQHSNGTRTSESEDRVFSRKPEIAIDGVRAVHVLLKEHSEYRSPEVRTILITAKKRNIPAYLYTDENAWRLQDTRKAVTPGAAAPLLKGQQQKGYSPSRPPTMYLEPWLELIYKSNKASLTPRAEKLRHDLVYYGSRYRDEDSGLGTDMSNARKPNSTDYPTAVKINDYMRKNKFANTVALKNAIADKWENIK
jgi:predicted HTH domain antitoxin